MEELSPGAKAPPFSLPRLGGGEQALPPAAPLSVLLFVKLECSTSQLTLPFFGRLVAAYGDRIPFAVVAENEEEEGRQVAAIGGLPEGIVHLEPAPYAVSAAYGLRAVPSLFLIDGAGVVVERLLSWERAEYEALNARLAAAAGVAPRPLLTEADGAVPPARPG